MFDKHMICDGTLRNTVSGEEVTGFAFEARLPYYRGLGLSMVEDVAVVVDDERMARDAVRVTLRDRTWTLDEMESEYGDRWNFGEKATISVVKPGGLPAGEHRLELSERLRVSYLPFVPTTTDRKTLAI